MRAFSLSELDYYRRHSDKSSYRSSGRISPDSRGQVTFAKKDSLLIVKSIYLRSVSLLSLLSCCEMTGLETERE